MSNHDVWPPRLPKICGADVELGNFVLGGRGGEDTAAIAAQALLQRIDGVSSKRRTGCQCASCVARRAALAESDGTDTNLSSMFDPQDRERRFLRENGGCAYIDLDHLEVCLPEVWSPFDHVAAWHAMLRIARGAQIAANARRRGGRIQVLVNNRDGRGNSYGSHLNVLITRRAWNHLFSRRMHYLLYLAAYQVSSIVITGQGKVGSENGQPAATFQLSQRADFIETLTGAQTTYFRPIVNARDEPLCGAESRDDAAPARLHSIFFDSTLCHVASLLKIGVLQIVLAMIEAERVNPDLVLDDPLAALAMWSRNPSLDVAATLASGKRVTAVELQRRFFEDVMAFAESGELDAVVPRAREVLTHWDEVLRLLDARDLGALTPKLDWVLKLSLLDRAMSTRSSLDWDSPEIRHLDHVYSSLDPEDGLYWACERRSAVDRVVSDDAIAHFTSEPPADTRAWDRAMLLRALPADQIEDVNWDVVRVQQPGAGVAQTISLPHPARRCVEEPEVSHEIS